MNTLLTYQLASVSELQRDYLSLIQKIKKLAQPLFLLRRNQPQAVLISVGAFQELVEKGQLYEEKLALEAITEFKKEKTAGKLLVAKKPEDLFKRTK